jgi:hypothetical protein
MTWRLALCLFGGHDWRYRSHPGGEDWKAGRGKDWIRVCRACKRIEKRRAVYDVAERRFTHGPWRKVW